MEKNIWVYWHQGINQAPAVVKKCIKSWEIYNPNWKIHVLDEMSVRQYIDMGFLTESQGGDIAIQAFTDILRLKLVHSYGGVWVDATVFCCVPLDTWIHDALGVSNGFVCPKHSKGEKLIGNWFVAAEKNNETARKCLGFSVEYITKNQYKLAFNSLIGRKLIRWSQKDKKRTSIWFSVFVQDFMKLRPYFFFHYAYYLKTTLDDAFKARHESMYVLDAGTANFKRHGFFDEASLEVKDEIINRREKLYKLRWKDWPSDFDPESSVGFLFDSHGL